MRAGFLVVEVGLRSHWTFRPRCTPDWPEEKRNSLLHALCARTSSLGFLLARTNSRKAHDRLARVATGVVARPGLLGGFFEPVPDPLGFVWEALGSASWEFLVGGCRSRFDLESVLQIADREDDLLKALLTKADEIGCLSFHADAPIDVLIAARLDPGVEDLLREAAAEIVGAARR